MEAKSRRSLVDLSPRWGFPESVMFPADVLMVYAVAVLVVVIAPGPDNILAISRGLSQGPLAALMSSVGAGLGILCHSIAAAAGLSLLLQASPAAFWALKLMGAAYLLWLGVKAIRSRSLIDFHPAARQPLRRVFATGLLSNALNPKPGLFVMAFVPQFIDAERGSVAWQMLGYGAMFAILTVIIFTVLGCFASRLAGAVQARPRLLAASNVGAGMVFVVGGLSILLLDRRR